MWKILDKLEQIYLIGFETRIYMTTEEFNNLLTDERLHKIVSVKNDELELTQTGAEIRETGIYGRYKKRIEICIKKGKA